MPANTQLLINVGFNMTIKKTLLASVIALTVMSGMAHADSIAGALTELEAITPNMSQAEINQKIERFIERAPSGTNLEKVLTDFPLVHYIPGTTQSVQEKPHLDNNATDTERQVAQQAAENIAAYRHNNPEGIPTHQIGMATHLDGQHNVAQTPDASRQIGQRKLTEEKYAAADAPQNGVDGKNGADGKDGRSITGKTGANGKDADMTAVDANTAGLRGVRTEQAAQGQYIQQNGADIAVNQAHIASNTTAINQNSQDIAANRKDIDENSKDIKRVGAMAQAVSSLHYNRSESGYAVAAGNMTAKPPSPGACNSVLQIAVR